MWKYNLVFYISNSYLNFLYKYWRSQKQSSYYHQISITRYILTAASMGSSDICIHVYSIEVRFLSPMSIVNPFHARVYWPFEGDATFADPFFVIYVLVSLSYAVLSVPSGLVVT